MSAGSESADFRDLDFDRLWRGRDKVTSVERAVLRHALGETDPSRVLEIGVGAGRMAPVVQDRAREYAAVDLTRNFLERVPIPEGLEARRICATVYRLPFVDGAFRTAVMIRVFGFLEEPSAALAEIARVLAPGGSLVMTYSPRPSIETLVSDLKVARARRGGEPFRSMTFSRSPVVPVRPSAFPAWSCTRARFREIVDRAGLRRVREWPTGLEDYQGLRGLPAGLFDAVARHFPELGGFPSRFALLRTPGAPGGPLPAWNETLACPQCRARWPEPAVGAGTTSFQCPRCGLRGDFSGGILDARPPPSDSGADRA